MRKLPFWLHLIISLALAFLAIIGLTYFLDTYTKHGRTTEVPNVSKMKLFDAIKILKAKGFDVEVDSTYRDSLPPFYVIKQFPSGGDKVKTGRTIQLIANKGTAPMVAMPSLLGARVSSAIQFLERSNLKLGDTIFKPDFANGRILKQLANGDEIQPGTLVKYGTKVTLVIGSGVGSVIYNYPDFYGMTLQHALQVMDTLGLSRGAVSVDKGTKDSLRAYVYKQYPEAIDMFTRQPTLIRQGMTVDLFISNIRKPREIDTSASMISDEQLEEAKADDLKSQKETGTEEKKDKKQTPKKKPIQKPTKAPAEVKPAPPPPKKDEYEG